MRPGMKRYHISFLLIILVAFALRMHNLNFHSLWFDEAISVHWAKQSVPRILEVGFTLVEDRLPPLYYLMLKGWTMLVGFSESGVRSLSVFIGVLLVPVSANIARLLVNRRVAQLTALLVALNPFLIWYAQEARMYAPVVLFSTFSVWAFLRMINLITQLPHKNFWSEGYSLTTYTILFILASLAGLYSHLYSGFLLPAMGLWLIVSYPRAWRSWLYFALCGLLITLAYLPILFAIWRFSGEATPGEPLAGLGQRAWWLLQVFIIWKAPLAPILQIFIPLTTLIFVLLAYLKRPATNQSTLLIQLPIANLQSPISNYPYLRVGPTPNHHFLITLLLITPFLIATILLFRNHLAFFGERYFIIMVPWLLLLAAIGAYNLSKLIQRYIFHNRSDVAYQPLPYRSYGLRFLSYLPALLLLMVTAMPIPGQWSKAAAKEFWRQSVAYLADYATPHDGILIHPDWVRHPFQFYFTGPGQTYAAFSNVDANSTLEGPLQGVVGEHQVVWLIQSHVDGPDPDRRVERWFANRYPLVTELYPPGIALKGYATNSQLDRLPQEATPLDLQFENGMKLIGYQADSRVSATESFFHPPSGWVHVVLYWAADQPITEAGTPFVHLVGPEGVWGVNLERTNGALNFFPPTGWPTTDSSPLIIRQDLDVNLNPATPPGVYQLVLGLKEIAGQLPLTTVEVY